MGVHDLWTLLSPAGRRIDISSLKGMTLAVDASIWVVQFLSAMRDPDGNVVRNAHLLGTFRRICRLLFHKIKVVFVFDGAAPALKRRTVLTRQQRRKNQEELLKQNARRIVLMQLENQRESRKRKSAKSSSTELPFTHKSIPLPRPVESKDKSESSNGIASENELGPTKSVSAVISNDNASPKLDYPANLSTRQNSNLPHDVTDIPSSSNMEASSDLESIADSNPPHPSSRLHRLRKGDSSSASDQQEQRSNSTNHPNYRYFRTNNTEASSLFGSHEGSDTDSTTDSENSLDIEKVRARSGVSRFRSHLRSRGGMVLYDRSHGARGSRMDLEAISIVDSSTFSELPPHMQKEYIQSMKEAHRVFKGQCFQSVSADPLAFSESQFNTYLSSASFHLKLNSLQEEAKKRHLLGKKVLTESDREYILTKDAAPTIASQSNIAELTNALFPSSQPKWKNSKNTFSSADQKKQSGMRNFLLSLSRGDPLALQKRALETGILPSLEEVERYKKKAQAQGAVDAANELSSPVPVEFKFDESKSVGIPGPSDWVRDAHMVDQPLLSSNASTPSPRRLLHDDLYGGDDLVDADTIITSVYLAGEKEENKNRISSSLFGTDIKSPIDTSTKMKYEDSMGPFVPEFRECFLPCGTVTLEPAKTNELDELLSHTRFRQRQQRLQNADLFGSLSASLKAKGGQSVQASHDESGGFESNRPLLGSARHSRVNEVALVQRGIQRIQKGVRKDVQRAIASMQRGISAETGLNSIYDRLLSKDSNSALGPGAQPLYNPDTEGINEANQEGPFPSEPTMDTLFGDSDLEGVEEQKSRSNDTALDCTDSSVSDDARSHLVPQEELDPNLLQDDDIDDSGGGFFLESEEITFSELPPPDFSKPLPQKSYFNQDKHGQANASVSDGDFPSPASMTRVEDPLAAEMLEAAHQIVSPKTVSESDFVAPSRVPSESVQHNQPLASDPFVIESDEAEDVETLVDLQIGSIDELQDKNVSPLNVDVPQEDGLDWDEDLEWEDVGTLATDPRSLGMDHLDTKEKLLSGNSSIQHTHDPASKVVEDYELQTAINANGEPNNVALEQWLETMLKQERLKEESGMGNDVQEQPVVEFAEMDDEEIDAFIQLPVGNKRENATQLTEERSSLEPINSESLATQQIDVDALSGRDEAQPRIEEVQDVTASPERGAASALNSSRESDSYPDDSELDEIAAELYHREMKENRTNEEEDYQYSLEPSLMNEFQQEMEAWDSLDASEKRAKNADSLPVLPSNDFAPDTNANSTMATPRAELNIERAIASKVSDQSRTPPPSFTPLAPGEDPEMASIRLEMIAIIEYFGLPYIVAPAEAEAQCAELERAGIVDGVITEDSDVFLFGAKRVFKNIFVDRSYVEAYRMEDITTELGLDRSDLIDLALLLGSDYTTGVYGVGIVNGMEILKAFPKKNRLGAFADWMKTVVLPTRKRKRPNKRSKSAKGKRIRNSKNQNADDEASVDLTNAVDDISTLEGSPRTRLTPTSANTSELETASDTDTRAETETEAESEDEAVNAAIEEFARKHPSARRQWILPLDFPHRRIIEAYTKPAVHVLPPSMQRLRWQPIDRKALIDVGINKFGWAEDYTQRQLDPVIRASEEYQASSSVQRSIMPHLSYEAGMRRAEIRSKRLRTAIEHVVESRTE